MELGPWVEDGDETMFSNAMVLVQLESVGKPMGFLMSESPKKRLPTSRVPVPNGVVSLCSLTSHKKRVLEVRRKSRT